MGLFVPDVANMTGPQNCRDLRVSWSSVHLNFPKITLAPLRRGFPFGLKL
jgi:hypothetical protein